MIKVAESKLRKIIRSEYIKVLSESRKISRRQLLELGLEDESLEKELGGAEWYNPKTGKFEKKEDKSQDRFAGLGSKMDKMSGRMKEADDAIRTTRSAYLPKPGEEWDAPRGTSGHRKPMKAQGDARFESPGARAGRKR